MADLRRWIQSWIQSVFADAVDFVFPGIPLCIEKATSKFMSSISSLWNKYLQSNKQIAKQNSKRERDALSEKENTMEANFLWELRRYVLLLAMVAASITYSAALSPPGGFSSHNRGGHLAGDPMLRGPHQGRYVAFFYFNATAFAASLAVVMLLLSRPVTRHGFCSCALWACMGAVLMGLTGAFATGSGIIFETSIYATSLMAVVLLYTVLHVLFSLRKPVENWLGNVQETQQRYQELDQLFLSKDHRGETSPYDPQGNLDADQLLKRHRKYLLLLAILATSVTYQAGLNPPGGFWPSNPIGDGPDHHSAGDPIVKVTYPRRYLGFFYFSLVILILLLSSTLGTQGIKYCALQVTMIVDILWLIGGYASGSCRSDPAAAEDDPDRATSKRNCEREATWHVACAAAHHMTGDLRLLLAGSYSPVHDDDGNGGEDVLVHQSSGEPPLRVRGSGSVRTESIALDDVWYVPGLGTNLVSTGQLARLGCAITLGPGGCRITRGDALVGSARFTDGYQFELDFLKVAAASSK